MLQESQPIPKQGVKNLANKLKRRALKDVCKAADQAMALAGNAEDSFQVEMQHKCAHIRRRRLFFALQLL